MKVSFGQFGNGKRAMIRLRDSAGRFVVAWLVESARYGETRSRILAKRKRVRISKTHTADAASPNSQPPGRNGASGPRKRSFDTTTVSWFSSACLIVGVCDRRWTAGRVGAHSRAMRMAALDRGLAAHK